MTVEFRDRISKKRKSIEQIRQKCKEIALKETTVICERCRQDLSKLKTFDFISEELHHARSVFGSFKRVEISEVIAKNNPYQSDKDFIEIYTDAWKEEFPKGPPPNGYLAFCSCRSGHIIGIIRD